MTNVYLICAEINGKKLYKIGYTKRTIEKRIKEFRTGNASDFSIVDSFRSKWGSLIESRLHKLFIEKKINGEWFNLSDDDILNFRNHCEIIHNNLIFIESENNYFIDRGKF